MAIIKKRSALKRFVFKFEGGGPLVGQKGKYYPAEDLVPKKGPLPVRNPPKLRKSIVPGTIVILVAGRFKGKRVIVLKQLTSGLLLVTGPFAINGVPLRRVNQRYVIATSTKVDVSNVDVSNINDSFFARDNKITKKSAEETLLEAGSTSEVTINPIRLSTQVAVDTVLLSNIKKIDQLDIYLKSTFSLQSNEKPHLLKF
eukprot:gene19903-25858_t